MARWTRTALAGAVILAMTTACFFGGDDEGKDDQSATASAAGGGGDDEGSGGGGSTEVEIPWRTSDDPPLTASDFEVSYERNFLRRGTKVMKMAFKAKAEKKGGDDSRTARIKSTCKFGDELLVDTTSLMGSLDLKELEPGQTKKLDTRLYSNPGIEDLPEACEVAVMVGAIIDTKKPILISQQCIEGEKISEGACSAIERPDAKGDGPAVTPYDVTVENDEMGFGAKKKKHISVQFKARMERQVEDSTMVDVKSACKIGGETLVDTSTALSGSLSKLVPGEAVHMRVAPFAQEGLDGEPSQCTITVRKKVVFGDTEDLAEFCWKGDKVSKGAC